MLPLTIDDEWNRRRKFTKVVTSRQFVATGVLWLHLVDVKSGGEFGILLGDSDFVSAVSL